MKRSVFTVLLVTCMSTLSANTYYEETHYTNGEEQRETPFSPVPIKSPSKDCCYFDCTDECYSVRMYCDPYTVRTDHLPVAPCEPRDSSNLPFNPCCNSGEPCDPCDPYATPTQDTPYTYYVLHEVQTRRVKKNGLAFELGYIYWHTHHQQLPYAGSVIDNPFGDSYNGVTVDSNSKKIETKETSFGWDSGFRASLGYGCANDWQLKANYTYFYSSAESSCGSRTANRNEVFANLIDRSLAADAGLLADFSNGVIDYAQEKLGLHLNIADLLYQKGYQGRRCRFSYSAGARFAAIDQKRGLLYTDSDGVREDTYAVDMKNEMKGWGLRAASEAFFPICKNGTSLYIKGGLSLLLGRFDLSRYDRAYNDDVQDIEITNYQQKYNGVIPVLEIGAGISFSSRCWSLTVGYEFINWGNMFQHFDFSGSDDATGEISQARVTDGNLSFDGLFVELSRKF